jgi:type 1 glutamine amidotransferase
MGLTLFHTRAFSVAAWVLAIAAGALACGESDTPTAPTQGSPPKRLIVVTHTTGFRHPSIATAEAVLTRLADESRAFTVSFCRTEADVTRMLTGSGLANTNGVFFANTTGNLGIPDLGAFLQWIRDGHAFLGAHSASDTYHDAPEYLAMLGAEFDPHGEQTTVDLRVEDPAHPATASLPNPFTIFDEIYEFRTNPRGRSNILLSTDRHPNDGHPTAGQSGDFPIAWSHSYGSGRVFYTALGHRDEVWNDPRFQQHLLGAIRWAMP